MKLRDYQVEGVQWLTQHRFGLLGDEMGLGKTIQTSESARALGISKVVSICPASVRHQWRDEWARVRMPQSIVMGYEEAQKNLATIKALDPQLVVFDEVHYLKNPEAKRTQNLLALTHDTDFMWGLSGTIMPNHPGELWPWLYTTGATKMSYEAWVNKFCVTDTYGTIRGGKSLTLLGDALRRFMLRRTREDVKMELPPLTVSDLHIDPIPMDQGDFEVWFPKFAVTLGMSKDDIIAKLLSDEGKLRDKIGPEDLHEIETHLAYLASLRRYYGMLKMPGTAQLIIDEMKNGLYDKLVVFAVHRQAIMGLRQLLVNAGIDAVTLFGGTAKKETVIDRFIKNPQVKVMICNIAAGGIGIDGFQKVCNEVIFLEQEWTPGPNDQALARLYRSGQENPVNCRFIISGEIDELVSRALKRKMKTIQEVGL